MEDHSFKSTFLDISEAKITIEKSREGEKPIRRSKTNQDECISCQLSGWTIRVGEGQLLILKINILKTKALRS